MSGDVFAVGVTGHRAFDAAEVVALDVGRVADLLVERAGARRVEVWSSLAEGADRLVADAFAARGAGLVAVLPLPPADYRADFADGASNADFDRLLSLAADTRIVAPAVDREAAYAAAGRAVVDAVDVLVAVWDGRPARGRGGTAEIVAHAAEVGREVIVVPVTRGTLST